MNYINLRYNVKLYEHMGIPMDCKNNYLNISNTITYNG